MKKEKSKINFMPLWAKTYYEAYYQEQAARGLQLKDHMPLRDVFTVCEPEERRYLILPHAEGLGADKDAWEKKCWRYEFWCDNLVVLSSAEHNAPLPVEPWDYRMDWLRQLRKTEVLMGSIIIIFVILLSTVFAMVMPSLDIQIGGFVCTILFYGVMGCALFFFRGQMARRTRHCILNPEAIDANQLSVYKPYVTIIYLMFAYLIFLVCVNIA